MPREFTLAFDASATNDASSATLTWTPEKEAYVTVDLLSGGAIAAHSDADEGKLVVPSSAFADGTKTELRRTNRTSSSANGKTTTEIAVSLSRESDLRLP